MKCENCGGPTIPMLNNVVCKAECDKQFSFNFGDPGDENPFEDEPTQPFAMALRCPSCGSLEVEEFDAGVTNHCWECGVIIPLVQP